MSYLRSFNICVSLQLMYSQINEGVSMLVYQAF